MSIHIAIEPETSAEKQERGYRRQERRRATERQMRKGGLVYNRWMKMLEYTAQESAEQIDIHVRTLQQWEDRWKTDRLAAHGRGRPIEPLTTEQLQGLYETINTMGVQTGVVVLQGLFPGIPRAEVAYYLKEARRKWQEHEAFMIECIIWKHAGRVWAMDHLEAPVPIDGKYPYILAVRDLASGEMLLCLPVEHADGASTRDALKHLFKQHGAPLVLKSDNGSALICEEVSQLLRKKKIKKLLSPPGYPCYNGSIEAGIGALKTRTHHEAARHERPGEWTCDDVEAARLQANYTARPRGAKGSTPQQMWENRSMILAEERESFFEAVSEQERKIVQKHKDEAGEFTAREVARIERTAISTALKRKGYFVSRRRRIIPPIFRNILHKIS